MKKKGFVFLESIVILVATMLSLTILLVGYSVITRKSKIKEEYDRTSDKYLLYNISILGTTDTKNYNSNEKNFKAEKGLCEYLPVNDIDNTIYINEILSDCNKLFKDSNLLYIYTVRNIEAALNGQSETVIVNKQTKSAQSIYEPSKIYDNGTIEYMKTLKRCNTYNNDKICIEPVYYMIGVFEKDNTNYFASVELEALPITDSEQELSIDYLNPLFNSNPIEGEKDFSMFNSNLEEKNNKLIITYTGKAVYNNWESFNLRISGLKIGEKYKLKFNSEISTRTCIRNVKRYPLGSKISEVLKFAQKDSEEEYEYNESEPGKSTANTIDFTATKNEMYWLWELSKLRNAGDNHDITKCVGYDKYKEELEKNYNDGYFDIILTDVSLICTTCK